MAFPLQYSWNSSKSMTAFPSVSATRMIRSPVCGYVWVTARKYVCTTRGCPRARDLQSGIGRSSPKATRRASLSSTASRNPSPDVSYLRIFVGVVALLRGVETVGTRARESRAITDLLSNKNPICCQGARTLKVSLCLW